MSHTISAKSFSIGFAGIMTTGYIVYLAVKWLPGLAFGTLLLMSNNHDSHELTSENTFPEPSSEVVYYEPPQIVQSLAGQSSRYAAQRVQTVQTSVDHVSAS